LSFHPSSFSFRIAPIPLPQPSIGLLNEEKRRLLVLSTLSSPPLTRHLFLARVGGRGDGDGRAGSSAGNSGDSPARAGRGVLGTVVAGGGVGRDGGRDLGDLTVGDLAVATDTFRGRIDGDGDGSGGGGDGGLEEGRAVGLAAADGQETRAGTGDLTVAVVTAALALLEDRAENEAGEGKYDGGLHFDGLGWRVFGRDDRLRS